MEINIETGLKNRIPEFFIQTLSLLFFPEDNIFGKNKSGNYINIFSGNITKTTAELGVKIYYNTKNTEKKRVINIKDFSSGKNFTAIAGRVFFEAAYEITGIKPPWGIHTGIRPAKFAGAVLESHNFNEKAAIGVLTKKYLMSKNKAELAVNTYKNRVYEVSKNEFSLYISIPFCPTRCDYCSFISYASPKLLKLIPEYLKKLSQELVLLGKLTQNLNLRLKTVYIGGGTPAVLSAEELGFVLCAVRDNFDLDGILEYSVELGRADVITPGKLELLKKHGVNRVSLNPQSLNDEVLKKNGRAHTAEEFFEAFRLIGDFEFRSINADCIMGLPFETFESMIKTVEGVCFLRPENITLHTLCIKKSAELKKKAEYTPADPGLNRVIDMCYNILKSAGFKPYYLYRQKYASGNLENTGFCLDGHECLYNVYMMDEIQTIFGAGAGAVSKLVKLEHGEKGEQETRIERIVNYKYPFEYTANDFKIESVKNKTKLEILRSGIYL